MRPNSIVQFERLFLASFAVRLLNDAMTFSASINAEKPGVLIATYGAGAVLAAMSVIYLVGLCLWYFAARRQSVVAKWLISAWFVVACSTMALGLFKGAFGLDLASGLAWISFLLMGWSVSFLFKPDADEWFAKR